MTLSLRRWFVALWIACAAASPVVAHAQSRVSTRDATVKVNAALRTVQADQQADQRLSPSSPSPSDRVPLPANAGPATQYGMLDTGLDPWSANPYGAYCCEPICCVPSNWFSADYLLWWSKGNNLPALVTTSPAGTTRASAGVIGSAGTTVLYGNGEVDDENRSGMRFTLGHWSDPEGTIGLQATYFAVFDDDSTGDYFSRTNGALGGGAGSPILARPFFDVGVVPNRENSQLVSFTGPPAGAVVDGTININSSSEIQSGSLMLRRYFQSGSRGRVDLVGGYRYFRLRESLLIQQNSVSTEVGTPIVVGTTFSYEDMFRAENEFHGGDLGFVAQFWEGNLTLEVLAKVALGNLHRSATIQGNNTITPTGGAAVGTAGGLLALPTNIGTRTANDFAALPEVGINIKYEPSASLSFHFGYTFLGLNDVTRTGEMIDRVVNSTQTNGSPLVGLPRPMFLFGASDFWAQGLNFGVTISR